MEKVYTDNAPAAIGPYSQGVKVDRFLYISGQIPINPSTGLIDGKDISSQTEQACINIGAILKESGVDFDQVIKTTCYLRSMADFNSFNEVYSRYFVSKPARSCVAVLELPKNALCEIEAVAILEEGEGKC